MMAASLRRSSSSDSWSRRPWSRSASGPPRSGSWRATTRKSRSMSARSVAIVSSIPGRSTLTAATRPSCNTARCTTASDARPRGSGSKRANASSGGRPSSAATAARTSPRSIGGPVSRVERNSLASSSPNSVGAEAMSWPYLRKVAPRSSNTWRSRGARSGWVTGRPRARRTSSGPRWRPTETARRADRRARSRRPGWSRSTGVAGGARLGATGMAFGDGAQTPRGWARAARSRRRG